MPVLQEAGGYGARSITSKDILELIDGDGWSKVGTMKNARIMHALSSIKYDEFKDYILHTSVPSVETVTKINDYKQYLKFIE